MVILHCTIASMYALPVVHPHRDVVVVSEAVYIGSEVSSLIFNGRKQFRSSVLRSKEPCAMVSSCQQQSLLDMFLPLDVPWQCYLVVIRDDADLDATLMSLRITSRKRAMSALESTCMTTGTRKTFFQCSLFSHGIYPNDSFGKLIICNGVHTNVQRLFGIIQ